MCFYTAFSLNDVEQDYWFEVTTYLTLKRLGNKDKTWLIETDYYYKMILWQFELFSFDFFLS